jgi:hypothetical protein
MSPRTDRSPSRGKVPPARPPAATVVLADLVRRPDRCNDHSAAPLPPHRSEPRGTLKQPRATVPVKHPDQRRHSPHLRSSLHRSSLHRSSLHRSSLHRSSLHRSSLHRSSLHRSSLHRSRPPPPWEPSQKHQSRPCRRRHRPRLRHCRTPAPQLRHQPHLQPKKAPRKALRTRYEQCPNSQRKMSRPCAS